MKNMKKFGALLLALVMALLAVMGSMTTAYAEGADVELQTERNGDTLTLKMVAKNEISFGGLDAKLSYDESAFTKGKTTAFLGLYGVLGTDTNKLVLSNMNEDEVKAAAGDVLFQVEFQVNEGYQKGTEYTFGFEMSDAYDFHDNTYSWNKENVTVTYKEDVAKHTVQFVSNGEVLNTVEVEDGQPVAKPENPTREGYTFKGWQLNGADYDFDTPVTEDITLVAAWEAEAGTIDKDVDLSEVQITKNVKTNPEGLEYPKTPFTFEFEGVSVKGNNGQVTTPPALGPLTITMPGESNTVALGTVEFELGGVYTYKVTEKQDAAENSGWTYDKTVYYLVLEVEEVNGKLELNSWVVHKDSATGEKAELTFENTYAPTTDLTITKTVEATDPNPAEQGKKFDFSITFNKGFVGKINGQEVTFTAGVAYEFQLADGESLKIENIPAGTTYTLVEAGAEYYTATATVTEGETKKDAVEGEYGKGVTVTGTAVAAKADQNKVEVVNEYSITPPTGITIHGEMIGIMVLVLVAMAGSFILSRKLRRA